MDNEELAEYLYKRFERLLHCNSDFETRISKDAQELCAALDDGKISKDDADTAAHRTVISLTADASINLSSGITD